MSHRFFKHLHIFIITLLFLPLASTYSQENIIDGIAAIIGDQIVLKSDVLQIVQMAAIERKIDPSNQEEISRLQNQALQNLIDQKIILEIAEAESIEVKEREIDTALEQYINSIVSQAGSENRVEEMVGKSLRQLKRELWSDIKDQLVIERFRETIITEITLTKNEVEDFYYQYKDSLSALPTLYNLQHIIFKIKPGGKSKSENYHKIEMIRERILRGENFSEIAKKHSQDPGSAKFGGELGFVERGTFVPNFEEVAFSLQENEISEIVETPFGYHIIQLLERRGDKVNVRHILIVPQPSNEDIDSLYAFISSVRDSIIETDDFETFAKNYHEGPLLNDANGNLGWINPQTFLFPEIAKVLSRLKINEISYPIRSKNSYHLVRIIDRREGGSPDLERHWTEIENIALMNKRNDYFNNWISKARKNIFVEKYVSETSY